MNESKNLRFRPSSLLFKGSYNEPCLKCGKPMLILDRVEDGDIWCCPSCMAPHEMYNACINGIRQGCVRLLLGVQIRSSGEPTVTEFMGSK